MPRRDGDPDFVEAIARGLDVIRSFEAGRPSMSLSEVAAAADLARPTARRILRTLELLGYVRRGAAGPDGYTLTPRVLELGHTYIQSLGIWDIARPHLRGLVARTHESSSIAQLDGSDIVYVARVAVPKIIALSVDIGTRFPAPQTSLGKVLLAGLTAGELDQALSEPSRVALKPRWQPDRAELDAVLSDVRARGWALTDEQLAPGIRSVAAPLRDGGGRVFAAMNVTVHAAETSVETLQHDYLPLLLEVASELSADFARYRAVSRETLSPAG
jgi:IclR family pca regulon transcriptional regulator